MFRLRVVSWGATEETNEDAPLNALKLRISTLLRVGELPAVISVAAVVVKLKVSVPAPISTLSKMLRVVPVPAAVPIKVATAASLPVVPVIVSRLVVSELFCTQNEVNTRIFQAYLAIRPYIDPITTNDHQ